MLAADAELDAGPDRPAAIDADAHELAHALLIDGDEGVGGQDALLGVGPQEVAASSREMPSAVCVRSLVPKEKNSAVSAMSPARRAARGSSIIVPT